MSKKKKSKVKQEIRPKSSKPIYNNLLIAVILGVFAFLIYSNTLGNGYVLDDYSAIKDNYVTKQGLEGIPTIWKEHYRFGFWNSQASLYRPLTLTIFAVIWEISPDNTFLYHLVNVLFFAFTASLLFLVLRKLLPNKTILFPLVVTALFVVHPIHVEVVANIKSLDEILALFFSLKAIYLLWKYLNTRKHIWLISSISVYGLALFSKESAVVFIFIFPLILYFFTKEKMVGILKISILYVLPAALFMYIRSQIVGSVGVGDSISFLDNAIFAADGFMNQMAMTFVFLGKYLLNLIAPYQLGSDFGYNQIPVTTWADWRPILTLILYTLAGVFALWKIKDKHMASFGILFFLITFAPLSNVFIKIGTSYGDRIVYIPSVGFLIAFVYGLFKIFKIDMEKSALQIPKLLQRNKYATLFILVVMMAFSTKTMSRNQVWDTSYSLYKEDIKIAPNSAKLRYHYSLELSKKGLDETDQQKKRAWFDQAKNQLEKAVEIYPEYHDAYAQLGLYYYRVQQKDKALEMYNKSIEHKPNSPKAYSNMGIIYFERGDVVNAQRVYEKAVQLDPKYVDARRNLGSVYARKGEFDKAIQQFSEALKYEPNDATINFYLGSSYKDSGNLAKGQPYLDKACRLDQKLCKK